MGTSPSKKIIILQNLVAEAFITIIIIIIIIIITIIIIHLFQFGFTKTVHKIIDYNMTNNMTTLAVEL